MMQYSFTIAGRTRQFHERSIERALARVNWEFKELLQRGHWEYKATNAVTVFFWKED